MAFDIIGVESDSSTVVGTSVTPSVDGDAAEGHDVWCHIMFSNPDVVITNNNDWDEVEFHAGPTYASVLLHITLTDSDTLAVTWTGNSHWTYQTIAVEGTSTEPNIDYRTTPSLGSAVLGRLIDLPGRDETHMLYFAGSINPSSKLNVSVRPDVGWMRTLEVEDPAAAGQPVCWCGEYDGPLGDTDVTLSAAVYYDPPPSHSIGHSVAVNVSTVTVAGLEAVEGQDTATVDLTVTLGGNFAATDEPINIDWGDTNDDDETVDAGEDTFDHAYQVFDGPYEITVTALRSGNTGVSEFDPVDPMG